MWVVNARDGLALMFLGSGTPPRHSQQPSSSVMTTFWKLVIATANAMLRAAGVK